MKEVNPQIDESWKRALSQEFEKDYFVELKHFLEQEKQSFQVYPPGPQIFSAFNHTPFPEVKVVIIGQDPYHGPKQANGLSFSVSRGVRTPPSLKNIHKELQSDLGLNPPEHGNLENWSKQGVLLLNTVLTVRHKSPGSHRNQGWEKFTDAVITTLSRERQHLVFFLWGKFAQGKVDLIDTENHCIIQSPHPSPYSASSGFFGSRPFSRANEYLKKHGKEPVQWQL